jgi:plastocyanin
MKPIWGGVLLIALTLGMVFTGLSCKKDSNPAGPGGGGADVTINIIADNGSSAYGASATTVTVGQTVSWKNTRGIAHTATADGSQFNTGTIVAGATSTPITMNTAGSFPYHCLIHGVTMSGTLTVNP